LRRAPIGQDGIARVAPRQIYILPTAAGLLYGAVVFVMLLGSLNYQNNLGLFFTFFMVSLGLVAMHHCWFNLLDLAVQVRPGPPVFAGSAAPFEVTLMNGRAGERYDIRVLGGLDPVPTVRLEPRDQEGVTLSVATERRGLHRLTQVEIQTRHPMGLFRAWCLAASEAACLVYPRPAPAAPPPIQDLGDARRPASGDSAGADDYLGPREYRHGDSPRHLDWKARARERGLVVKHFGGDQGLDVWIDWQAMQGSDREGRISLLTRQVLDAAQSDCRFGMRLPGIQVPLGRGDAHLQRCLTELALFDPGQGQAIADRQAA
jgi:uncharacterized protein (DUF58 family)